MNFTGSGKSSNVPQSVIDTIMKEAVYGNYEDARMIASSVANRAALTNQTWSSIISAPKQYSAFNKAYPAGVNTKKQRALVEQAVKDVLENGPLPGVTYYATPEAVDRLPGGLKQIGRTKGHITYVDPQNRAIRTATGYVKPDPVKARAMGLPQTTSVMPTAANRVAESPPSSSFLGRPSQVASNSLGRPVSSASLNTPPGGFHVTGMLASAGSLSDPRRGSAIGIDGRPTRGAVAQNLSGTLGGGLARGFLGGLGVAPTRDVAVKGDRVGTGAFESLAVKGDRLGTPAPMRDYGWSSGMKPGVDRAKGVAGTSMTDPGYIDAVRTAYATEHPVQKPDEFGSVGIGGLQPIGAETAITGTPPAIDFAKSFATGIMKSLPKTMAYVAPPVVKIVQPRTVRTVQRTVRQPTQIAVIRPSLPGGTWGSLRAQDRYSVGSGLRAMQTAMGGPRGATATNSTPGYSYSSLGPSLGGIRAGPQGWQVVGPDGSTSGGLHSYDSRPSGGFLGALSSAFGLGGDRGGSSSGGKSGGGKSGGGKSGGGKSSGGGGWGGGGGGGNR